MSAENYEIIPFDKAAHLAIVRQWWAAYYGGEDLPDECLPDSGAVAVRNGDPQAVAFLYKANAKMAHIHFPMVNPGLGAGKRVDALKSAIEGAIQMARDFLDGQGFIWCCTDHAVVARVYGMNGMTCVGEADVYYMPVGSHSCEFLQ